MVSKLADRLHSVVLGNKREVGEKVNSTIVAIDAELQEVRAVLSLTADRHYPEHGHCWCRKDLTNGKEPHSEFCQRARALMEKLKV